VPYAYRAQSKRRRIDTAGLVSVKAIFIGLKIFTLDDYRSTKNAIYKLPLDFGLKLWLFDDYGY
jgi:hypothetical protein